MPVLRIVDQPVTRMNGPVMTTLSGITKKSGVVVSGRVIKVYADRGLTQFLATTYSEEGGAWSVSVMGGGASRFTVVAMGESGENDQVFSDVVA